MDSAGSEKIDMVTSETAVGMDNSFIDPPSTASEVVENIEKVEAKKPENLIPPPGDIISSYDISIPPVSLDSLPQAPDDVIFPEAQAPQPSIESEPPPTDTSNEDNLTQRPPQLNERQLELLEKLKSIKSITRKDYAEMFGISVPTAARDLKELVDKNILRPRGPLGPGRRYELNS